MLWSGKYRSTQIYHADLIAAIKCILDDIYIIAALQDNL